MIYYFETNLFFISNGFGDILKKKKLFLKRRLSGARGRTNVLTWVKTRLKYRMVQTFADKRHPHMGEG